MCGCYTGTSVAWGTCCSGLLNRIHADLLPVPGQHRVLRQQALKCSTVDRTKLTWTALAGAVGAALAVSPAVAGVLLAG